MNKIKSRRGKTIAFRWSVMTNGEAVSLEGRDLTLKIVGPDHFSRTLPFQFVDNVVFVVVQGTMLTQLGDYVFTLYENMGKEYQTVVDTDAVYIVDRTSKETPWLFDTETVDDIVIESTNLGVIDMSVFGGTGIKSITEELSDEDGGDNLITFELTTGHKFNVTIRNGKSGKPGEPGRDADIEACNQAIEAAQNAAAGASEASDKALSAATLTTEAVSKAIAAATEANNAADECRRNIEEKILAYIQSLWFSINENGELVLTINKQQ